MGIVMSIIILKPEELTWSRVQITNKKKGSSNQSKIKK